MSKASNLKLFQSHRSMNHQLYRAHNLFYHSKHKVVLQRDKHMSKNTFTQEEVAQKLGIQLYMLTAWEKQFEVKPIKDNETALYTTQDLATFQSIKELLYEKGLTMAAAKKALQDTSIQYEGKALHAASPLFFEPARAAQPVEHTQQRSSYDHQKNEALAAKLLQIKAQLIKITTSL